MVGSINYGLLQGFVYECSRGVCFTSSLTPIDEWKWSNRALSWSNQYRRQEWDRQKYGKKRGGGTIINTRKKKLKEDGIEK